MYKNILVPIDMGHEEISMRMIAKAKSLLDEGGKITLLHVMDEVPSYARTYMTPEAIEENLRQVRGELEALAKINGGNIATEVKSGRPSPVILDEAAEIGADLIIMASHRPDLTNFLLGSTAQRVVRHAKCSVLIDR